MTLYRHRLFGPGSAGDIWSTGLHAFSISDIQAAHDAFVNFVNAIWTGAYATMVKTTTSVAGVVTDRLSADGHHALEQRATAAVHAGSGTGAAPSPRACFVVGLRTDVPSKAGRGRMFWPSLDGSHYETNGLFKSADVSTLADAFDDAFSDLQATQVVVLAHRGPPNVTMETDNVTSIKIGNIPGTQRRRTNKVTNVYQSRSV